MTREDFEHIDSWGELISTACDYGYDWVVEGIYYADSADYLIEEELHSRFRDGDSWREILEWLADLPDYSYCDYLIRDDYGEYRILDDEDFDGYKYDLMEAFDNDGEFDEDEEAFAENHDEDIEEEIEKDTEDEPFEQGCAFDDLINSGIQIIRFPTSEEDKKRADEIIQMLTF